jgi:hypothetical protein
MLQEYRERHESSSFKRYFIENLTHLISVNEEINPASLSGRVHQVLQAYWNRVLTKKLHRTYFLLTINNGYRPQIPSSAVIDSIEGKIIPKLKTLLALGHFLDVPLLEFLTLDIDELLPLLKYHPSLA